VILADSCILTDYLLEKTIWLVKGMRVHPERMRKNLESTKGLVFSGQVLLDLAAAGVLREDAYRIVQSHAMHCWETGGDFQAAIAAEPVVREKLTAEQLRDAFSVDRQLVYIDTIFRRVFGS
jgi:adenylosuccinate lyase